MCDKDFNEFEVPEEATEEVIEEVVEFSGGILVDKDEDHVEYSKLNLHPRSKQIQKNFNADHKVSGLTVAEKAHFDELYSEIKFFIFFGGQEPTNNLNWYSFLQHNIRVNALSALVRENKAQIAGFDGTAALSTLKICPKTEISVPATGSFVITLDNGIEVVIKLSRGPNSIEWTVYCKNSVEYSQWDKIFRKAIKKYNQYKNSVFDQDGNFINLPQVTFDDIFLDESIRNITQTNIIDYIDEKKVLLKKRNGIPTKRGIIFAGEPGTGKTFLSRVLANTLNTTFMVITNLTSLHELKNIFKFVTQFERVVLLFEDIDIYIKNRDLGSGLLPTMLNTLDGVEEITNHLVVICTTNNVEAFDKALKNRPGRFDLIVPFNAPSKELKCTMLKGFCKGKNITGTNFEKIIDKVPEKYTGAHLKELYISACVLAIEEDSVDNNNNNNNNNNGIVKLTTDIFKRALDRMKQGTLNKRVVGFGNSDN